MAGSNRREAKLVRTTLFEDTVKAHLKNTPSIEERLRAFIEAKRKRPPEKFSNEHKLNPPFDGMSECHLAGNSCLIFKDKGCVVQLLAVCNHDQLQGKKAKSISRQIKKFLR